MRGLRTQCAQIVLIFYITKIVNATEVCSEKNMFEGCHVKQYRDGDILLAAAMQVSSPDVNGNCVQEVTGVQLVETMNMIIDMTNKNDSILRGVKLGTVMIDTCSSDAHALQRVILDILPYVLHDGYIENNRTYTSKLPILAGLIGASLSSVSVQIAKILDVFQIPQVSYWSTSAELSDKSRFKYFFRIVPPDTYQVTAMTSFIKDRKWNYISVVYDDDAYGVSGYTELAKASEDNGICIAMSRAIPVNADLEYMKTVVQDLLAKETSRAVIIFTASSTAEKLLSAAQAVPNAVEAISWIGSDSWVEYVPRSATDSSYLDTLNGALGFSPKFYEVANLKEYMTNLTLAQNEYDTTNNSSRNPWFADFISKENKCSLNDTSSRRRCSPDEHLNPDTFRLINLPMADAVLAFINALDAYHRNVCKGEAGLCDAIAEKAGTNKVALDLYGYLRNVSFIGTNGKTFRFDENQDGPPIYSAFVYNKSMVESGGRDLREGWVNAGTYENGNISWIRPIPSKVESVRSVCSMPCGLGQATIQGTQVCCWLCETCSDRKYVSPNSSSCMECAHKQTPNATKDGCEDLPTRTMEYNSGNSIFPLALGAFGLIVTTLTTIIFIVYSDTAIVRASGKELCFFVLFGVFLTLMNCFPITSYPSTVACASSRVILSIGPTCMYVGLLMKTIRVVFIFQSRGILSVRTKIYLQPLPFICVTVGVASLQILVVVIWFLIDFPATEEKANYKENFVFLTCKTLVDIEILIGLIYPFVIIIICTILATVNRDVPTGFKETFYVGFSMYTTCVIWLTFLPIFLTESNDFPKKLTTVSVSLSLSAITILFCLFGPRCYTILFHPESNTSESVMTRTGSSDSRKAGHSSSSQKEKPKTKRTRATQSTREAVATNLNTHRRVFLSNSFR